MPLFTSQPANDLLLAKLTDDKLRFVLSIIGEYILNVKKYKVCCNEQSLPFFLILQSNGELFYYFFEENKWKKKFLCFCKETSDFYLTVDNQNSSYILVENEEKNCYLYYCNKNKSWTEKKIARNNGFKLLKWFVKGDKIYIIGTTANKSLTFWQVSTVNLEQWSKIYDYPLPDQKLLNIWFTLFTGAEFLTAEFNDTNMKLIYNSLNETGELLCKQTVTCLEHFKTSKPILLRDTLNEGIIFVADNRLFLYKYLKRYQKWVELTTNGHLFPAAVEEINMITGTANSHLALTKILNMELETPVVIGLDALIQAMEIKRAQSLGFHGIRKLGRKL
ncbi:MAG: hypothetical protein ACOX1Y_06295 [Zhaonellaceae bacterium]|nr:hypothetical protein [Clostridia bacterium]